MTENENKLIVVERSLATLANNPVAQIDIAKKVNTKVHEVFEINRLLSELNTRLFEDKGEILPVYQATSVKPEVNQDQSAEQQSRFKRLFTLGYQAQETSLGAELYAKKKDLPDTLKVDHLKGLGIKVYQIVNIQEESLSIHVLGKLYFSIERYSGRWNNSPVVLAMQSQGRILSFSLHSIPPADEVKAAFWENVSQILEDLSTGNFIPPLDPENSSSSNS